LKCTSAYPAAPSEMNLRTIPELARRFDVPVGLSDHTMGIEVPVAAVSLGASILEKHLTLSRDLKGPDSEFSLNPAEFRSLVQAVRNAEQALGTIHFGASGREAATRRFRRSLFVVADIRQGEVFSPETIRSIRPAQGLHPRHLPEVLGRRAARDLTAGTPLAWDMLEPAR